MSVLVKGMKMPKDCRECPLLVYYASSGDTLCFPTDRYLAENYSPIGFEGRANWCPLVEVKPHGRLIDADALIDNTNYIHKSMIFGGQTVYSQSAIDEAPAVIEAEET